MNTRELTSAESNVAGRLEQLDLKFELIFLTETALKKSIIDATRPVVDLLKAEQVHDYSIQQQGSDYKATLPCIILSDGGQEETKVSLYRPATKSGDTRLWPGRLASYASADQVLALFVVNTNIVFLNLSNEQEFFSGDDDVLLERLDSLFIETNEFTDAEETKFENSTSSEIEEPSRFEVSSYGWDSDVEGLVKRMNRNDIKLPGFQRGFVWSKAEQSRFIESLILGLPVPNIFLAKDGDSKTLNIIDGQQRLKTLQSYMSGGFSISNSKKIHQDLRGCYFNSEVAKSTRSKILSEADARALSDSILHSIVIRPDPSSDSPDYGYEYNNAVIQIFRRLNTSGKPLQPQEVRSCIFYGSFDDLLHELNEFEPWRCLFGLKHNRYKDVETILRFFALYEDGENYKSTMPSFLDKYMEENRNIEEDILSPMSELFKGTTQLLLESCGDSIFKTGGTFLLSKFDAVMVGLANALNSGIKFEESDIEKKVEELLMDNTYQESTEEFINDTANVINRIQTASVIFSR